MCFILFLLKLLHKKWLNCSGNTPGFQGIKGRMPCHYTVKKLPIGLHLVITVFPVTPFSTHAAQSLAFTIQSPILIGPSCSSMTQKEVCQSAMWTSIMCVFVLRSVCVIMHCHFEWCHIFLFSLPLFFWTPQFALLLLSVIPPLCYGFVLFPPCIFASLSLLSKQGSRAFGISS